MGSGFVARVRSLWRGVRRRDDVETEMQEEFRQHVELRTADLIRAGMPPGDAARQARIEFGSSARYTDEARASRGLHRVDAFRFSWLDVKLGARMLVKSPVISAFGVLALAMAIGIGAGILEVVTEQLYPTLPIAGGDRLVRIQNWDASAAAPEPRSMHDFLAWRRQLTSIEELGAYEAYDRNLITPDGRREPVRVAEISPSAFRLTGATPLFGRPLVETDARIGAEAVAVIGHDIWQRRFLGDTTIVGGTIRLGGSTVTVVGVMPDGFAFPHSQQAWLPLRTAEAPPREGPPIEVFGRLAPGATFESAQAELTAIGQRAAAADPATHEHLRPRVTPFVGPLPGERFSLALLAAWAGSLLVLAAASVNVASLLFARVALREPEIVVRHALGASRGRILGQIFAEALVLAGVAAVVGLLLARLVFHYVWDYQVRVQQTPQPFWADSALQPSTVLLAALLALLGAVLVALVPALKASGPQVRAGLQQIGAGETTLRYGGVWSIIIVVQVAFSVLCLPIAFGASQEGVRDYLVRSDFASGEYLTFRLGVDRESLPGETSAPSADERKQGIDERYEELKQQLMAEPGVSHVTFATRLPAMRHPLRAVEFQRGSERPTVLDANMDGTVPSASIDLGFFDAFGIRILAGRPFRWGDETDGSRVVIVNESFAKNLGGDPLGVRVRHAARADEQPGPWYEIVGVVQNLGMEPTDRGEADFLFYPASPDAVDPLLVAVRVSGDPAAFAPRLNTIARQLGPDVRLYEVFPLEELVRQRFLPMLLMMLSATGVAFIAMLLSAAGLFGLMAVGVARRTREIAIRIALGSSRVRVIAAVFGRAALQLAAGIVVGNLLIILLITAADGEFDTDVVLPLMAISALMLLVGLLACVVPARRALAIQPTEALKQL